MAIVTAPEQEPRRVFLAGSIDKGEAPNWQAELASWLSSNNLTVFNPRREVPPTDLDEQVRWEIEKIKSSDVILFVFVAGYNSPISIGELYYALALNKKVVVVCEPGFHARPNIHIMCSMYYMPCYDYPSELTLSDFL